jgi:DNA-binding NarL/FixJ family response regulator
MRLKISLAGSTAERERLRRWLSDSGFQVAGEFATLASARSSHLDVDAIVVAPRVEDREVDEPLTAREVEVLELLAEGLANKAIGSRLSISDQTVKFHVAAICGKLGATNRTDAVRRAIHRGLVAI